MTPFRVWAPLAHRVRVRLGAEVYDLAAIGDGWWATSLDAEPGTDYAYLLDEDEHGLPDPRSRWQPRGVHEASRIYDDSAYRWQDGSWPGRDWPGSIVYELHIGTFTSEGTFDAAIDRLNHLVDLGVTHVELLPVNAFNGVWNWGYDGVDWYAVHEPYGGPDGLKRFVDACHSQRLAVLLDVVYNHLGPSGNYLTRFGPYLATQRNAWGEVVNLDGPGAQEVRRYIIDNALMWLRDFHIDGLRLDAAHALVDTSTPHLLAELSAHVDDLEAKLGQPRILVAESDLNDPLMITPRSEGGYGLDAQWDDDMHHALHAILTGERQGYYVDFGSLAALAKVYTSAFLHDGCYSTFRGRLHGHPVDRVRTPAYRFIAYLQDHDQVGNRALGDRLPEITPPRLLDVGAVLLLTSPFTPMLWMGEEWAASTRWPFFTSHPEPHLAEAASRGRIEEFATHGWDIAEMLDPEDPLAFQTAKLNWSELSAAPHRNMLALYRRLIELRLTEPDLQNPRLTAVGVDYDEPARWLVVHRGGLRIAANFDEAPHVVPGLTGEVVLATGEVKAADNGLSLDGQSAAVIRVG